MPSPSSSSLTSVDRIYGLAREVFGDKDKAALWLKRPSRALGSKPPSTLLETDAGTQQVEQELLQIQHGFVA